MHADLTAVGVEGDGGETRNRGVDHHARDCLVGDEVGVVVQQRRRLDGDALATENDCWREQHIGFRNAGGCELLNQDRDISLKKHRFTFSL